MLSVLTADDPAVADTRCVVVGVALVYFRSAVTYKKWDLNWFGSIEVYTVYLYIYKEYNNLL